MDLVKGRESMIVWSVRFVGGWSPDVVLVYYYATAFDPLLDEDKLRGDRRHVSLILYKLDP